MERDFVKEKLGEVIYLILLSLKGFLSYEATAPNRVYLASLHQFHPGNYRNGLKQLAGLIRGFLCDPHLPHVGVVYKVSEKTR